LGNWHESVNFRKAHGYAAEADEGSMGEITTLSTKGKSNAA